MPHYVPMTSMNGATEAPNKFGSELRRAVLSSCVLALLSTGEHYGFDLVRSLSENYGMATQEGTVYPLLSRLQKDGAVTSFWQWSQFSANVDGLLNSTGVST